MSDDRDLPRPVNYDDLYPGRFLKAADLKGGKVTLRIRDVRTEMLADEKGGEKLKAILHFDRTDKALVMCKTNGLCLKAMFGPSLAAWIGKRVTLYPAPRVWKGEDAIRVWGSPEIERDQVVDIILPRKRPTKMTMHAVRPQRAPDATPAEPTP